MVWYCKNEGKKCLFADTTSDEEVPNKSWGAKPDTVGGKRRFCRDQGGCGADPRRPHRSQLPLETASSKSHPRGWPAFTLWRSRQQWTYAPWGTATLLQGRLLQCTLGSLLFLTLSLSFNYIFFTLQPFLKLYFSLVLFCYFLSLKLNCFAITNFFGTFCRWILLLILVEGKK